MQYDKQVFKLTKLLHDFVCIIEFDRFKVLDWISV